MLDAIRPVYPIFACLAFPLVPVVGAQIDFVARLDDLLLIGLFDLWARGK